MIDWQEKERVRARYGYRCAYCGLTEAQAGRELTIDHFQPRCAGGTDEPDNLVYACRVCNEIKGDQWNPDLPPVLHPGRDDLSLHVGRGPHGALIALTAAGGRHIAALRLSGVGLAARRAGRKPPRRPTRKRRS